MNSIVMADAIEQAEQLGRDHGAALGAWVIDGNTPEAECANIIRGYDDGDPEVMDMCPAPLSGEWSDSMTPSALLTVVGIEHDELGEYDDEEVSQSLCDAYESTFTQAWWDTVIAAARYQTS